MRRVRLGLAEVSATQIVEREHRFGIAGEGFGRRQLHRIEPRPDPLAFLVAERAKPALGRDAGAGENEDVFGHAPQIPYLPRRASAICTIAAISSGTIRITIAASSRVARSASMMSVSACAVSPTTSSLRFKTSARSVSSYSSARRA